MGNVYPQGDYTFKVHSRRARKNYPKDSQQLNADLGEAILNAYENARVDVHNPQVLLSVEVRDLDDDAAIILMVDANLQRESILPSERAFAYKMKLDAIKHQGERTDLTSTQVAQKSQNKWSVDILSEEVKQSRDQIRRFIRLTELIEPLRDMVDGIRSDGKKIAFSSLPLIITYFLFRN